MSTIDPDALDGAFLREDERAPTTVPPGVAPPAIAPPPTTRSAPAMRSAPESLPRGRTRSRQRSRMPIVALGLALALMWAAGAGWRRTRTPRPAPNPTTAATVGACVTVTHPSDAPAAIAAAPAARAPAPATSTTELRFPGDFSFNDASPNIDDTTLAALVALIRARCGHARIAITGHTCNRGLPETNLAVGRARAVSVARLLAASGIDSRRLDIRSAGSREPTTSNRTSEGRSANRRVVIACQP
jgi:outer membrane protein OmpA-like peptidoglycan-associated protein